MTAAIVNLTNELAIPVGTDMQFGIDIDDPEIDLTGTPQAEIRKFAVSLLPTAIFTATIDQSLRRLTLYLPRLQSSRLHSGIYTWSVLMVYPPTILRPDGWSEYLIRGRLEAVTA